MTPLLVFVTATAVLRLIGLLGLRPLATWRTATRGALAVMFLFTGVSHFTVLRYDYAAMVPPPLTGRLWVVYLTGGLEIAGAAGLLLERTRRAAALGLLALLVVIFPANVYASLSDVSFRGAPATDLWLRAPLQLLYLAALWWSAVHRTLRQHARHEGRNLAQPAIAELRRRPELVADSMPDPVELVREDRDA